MTDNDDGTLTEIKQNPPVISVLIILYFFLLLLRRGGRRYEVRTRFEMMWGIDLWPAQDGQRVVTPLSVWTGWTWLDSKCPGCIYLLHEGIWMNYLVGG